MHTPVCEPECPSIFTGRETLNAKVYDEAISIITLKQLA